MKTNYPEELDNRNYFEEGPITYKLDRNNPRDQEIIRIFESKENISALDYKLGNYTKNDTKSTK